MSQLSVTLVTQLKAKVTMKRGLFAFASGTLFFGYVLGTALVGVPSITWGYEYTTTSSSGMAQPKARWYRYYDSNGRPNLSSTITDQHLKYGYQALDANMQVIKRATPYTPDSYAVQKAKRDALEAKRQYDMNLKRTYGSASQAAAKRDQILADMASRKVYLQAQLTSLQRALSSDIAQAAVYERQRKAIPAALQKSLQTNRKNVSDAEQNIRAISERQQEIRQQYDETIRRLNKL